MKHLKNTLCTLVLALGLSSATTATTLASQEQACACFEVEVVGTGSAVILIPGLASSGDVWQDTVEALQGEYQLHVLTLAGFAGVEPLSADALRSGFMLAQQRAVLNYIVTQQLEKPVIIGHSLGGYLALALAARAPEQIGAAINVDGLPALGALFAQGQANLATDSEAAPPANFDPLAMAREMTSNESWHQRIVNDMFRSDGMTSALVMGELMTADLRPELATIGVPVLTLGALLNGAPYASTEQVQANFEGQFINAPAHYHSFAFAQDSRHFIMADAPHWLNQQIQQFLRNSVGGVQP